MSKATEGARNFDDWYIKDLAIRGPDAEMRDVSDGRRFFYYYDDSSHPLVEILQAGSFRFSLKYNSRPKLIVLSTEYKLKPGTLLAGLLVIPLENIPIFHFWFGPKPTYYQLRLDL